MIAELLALGSAFSFGWSDFSGGVAAKRAPATTVVFYSHVVGIALGLVLAMLLPGSPVPGTWAAGGLAGLSGAVGLVALYQGLANGRMAVVAPVSALLSTGLPVLYGVVTGERLGTAGWVGVAVALVAIVLVSVNGSIAGSGLREAIVAGIGFAGFFLALSVTTLGEGLWPLVPARMASLALLGVLLVTRTGTAKLPRAALVPTVLAGAGDMAANALYLASVQRGLLTSTVVLASLYPVVTVLAGRLVLRERVAPLQWIGIVAAVAAVTLLAG